MDSASDVDLSLASEVNTASADLTINARVAFGPEDLEQVVTTSVAGVAKQFGLTHTITGMQRGGDFSTATNSAWWNSIR